MNLACSSGFTHVIFDPYKPQKRVAGWKIDGLIRQLENKGQLRQ
jgi:hypothetical protein